jgi:hypothetical protein
LNNVTEMVTVFKFREEFCNRFLVSDSIPWLQTILIAIVREPMTLSVSFQSIYARYTLEGSLRVSSPPDPPWVVDHPCEDAIYAICAIIRYNSDTWRYTLMAELARVARRGNIGWGTSRMANAWLGMAFHEVFGAIMDLRLSVTCCAPCSGGG